MSDDQHIKDFQDKLKAFFVEFTSLVIDSLFLGLWIIVQWAVNEYIVKRFILEGIDQWMLEVFQKVFSGSTLILVLSYIVTDLITIIIRVGERITSVIREAKFIGSSSAISKKNSP